MSYKVELTEEENEKLAFLLKSIKDPKLYRRLLAISLRNKNYSFKEICVILQVSHKTATEWVKLFLDEQFEGLLTLNYSQNRTSKLDPYLSSIQAFVESYPDAKLKDIHHYISTELAVEVDRSWLYRYLIQHHLLEKGAS